MIEVTNLKDFELSSEKLQAWLDLQCVFEERHLAQAVGDSLKVEATQGRIEMLRERLRCLYEEQRRREQ